MQRPYESLRRHISSAPDRTRQMQSFVDLLWPALNPMGISWLGFYLHEDSDELILGPSRDKPACSPIGLHGACGQSFLKGEPIIVKDVTELGVNYIACDPRDRSEVVIPLFEANETCWGVFDVDSWEIGAFDQHDVDGLMVLLNDAGLSHPRKS